MSMLHDSSHRVVQFISRPEKVGESMRSLRFAYWKLEICLLEVEIFFLERDSKKKEEIESKI